MPTTRLIGAQLRRGRTALLAVVAVVLGSVATLAPAAPVAGASQLSNPSVTPGAGTPATTFTFAVDYSSSSPPRAPSSIVAELDGPGGTTVVPLSLVSGSATAGRYAGSRSGLSPGSYAVTFRAEVPHPNESPAPISGDPITVGAGGPSPTPAPTPAPTPRPSTPQPTPQPTAPPPPPPTPRVTPRPPVPTPRPPVPTPRPPGTTPAATPSPNGAASPPAATAGPSETASASTAPTTPPSVAASPSAASSDSRPTARASGTPSAEPAPVDEAGEGLPPGIVAMVVLGSATVAAGLTVLARLWLVRRSAPIG